MARTMVECPSVQRSSGARTLVECASEQTQVKKFRQKQPPEVFYEKRLRPATLFKKRLWHRCFPVNFAKLLRTSFLQNTSGQLFLFLIASPTKYRILLEEKLMAEKCAVPDPENTDDETRLLCSPNDKDTPQVLEESIN